MLVICVVAVLRARWLVASLRSVKWLEQFGFCPLLPAGAHGSFNGAELKPLSAPLLSLPMLPVRVAGPSLAFPPRAGVTSPARRPVFAAARLRRRCRRVKGALGFWVATGPAMLAMIAGRA